MSTPYVYRRPDTIHGQFGWCVERYPEGTALVHGERRVSYRELDALADGYAAALEELGVGPGQLVPVLLPRTVEMVAALLAILRRGAAYAALDPRWPRERLATLLSQVDGAVLVGGDDSWDRPHWLPAPSGTCAAATPVEVRGADPAVLFFTSGSTGTPKGVLLPHTGTTRLFDACEFAPFGPDVVQAQSMPMHWDGSILDLWSALLCGGTSVFVDEVIQPELLRRVIREYGVNGAGFLPGAVFNMIVDEDLSAFEGLRFLTIGGERLSTTHVARFLARYPETALSNVYGPVESTALTTAHRIDMADTTAPDGIPLGRPLTATGVHVLDGERVCAPGEVGELCLSGDGLALRYLNNPELTAEKFVEVAIDGVPTRVYRTGDLGRLGLDGLLHYVGRNDRQVKINGHRIEPGEIERTAERLPGVARAAVIPIPGPDGSPHALALYYVAEPAGSPAGSPATELAGSPTAARTESPAAEPGAGPATGATILAALRAQLPGYLVPGRLYELETLPLNTSGKIDRRALAALAAPTTHDGDESEPESDDLSDPRALLTAAFRQLTGATPAGGDSFFDLGGNSLDAARLCARISTALRVSIPVSQIYRTPSVDTLLPWLAAAPAQQATTVSGGDGIPLATGQANYIGSTGATICVLTWWVDGPLRADVLTLALGDVHRRHQSLHARYLATDPPTAQLPAEPGEPEVRVLDDGTDPLAAVNSALLEPLDVAAGQIWRAVLTGSGQRHLVGVGVHHIAFDGYSEELFARDLSFAYAARYVGTAPVWPEPAPTLADLGTRSVHRMRAEDLDAQRSYWQRQLRDLPRLRLPGLPPGPVPPAGPTEGLRFPVTNDEFAAWDEYAREHRISQFSYLLAIFGEVLRELTGRQDVGVLVPVALRGDPVVDAAITCRANPLVMRLRPAGGTGHPLSATAEAVSAALAAQDLPFGAVIGAVARVRPDLDALLNLPIFVVQDRQYDRLALTGCEVRAIEDRQARDIPSLLAIDLALHATGANLNVGVRTDLVGLDFAATVGEAYLRILRAGPESLARTESAALLAAG